MSPQVSDTEIIVLHILFHGIFSNWLWINISRNFHGGSVVKNLLATQETWVRSLVGEDPLGKEMATHSSIFAQQIPWTDEPGGVQSTGLQESDTT